MASRTDPEHDPEPDAEVQQDEIDEIIEAIMAIASFLALPPVFLYQDRQSYLSRILLWRYVYLAFAVGTVVMFAPRLLAGEYVYLIVMPVFYLVAIYTVGGPFVLDYLSSRDVGFTVPSSLPAPEGVVLPELTLAAAGTGAAAAVIGAMLVVFGRPASLKWKMKHATLDSDEFVVPLEVITKKRQRAPASDTEGDGLDAGPRRERRGQDHLDPHDARSGAIRRRRRHRCPRLQRRLQAVFRGSRYRVHGSLDRGQ